MEERLRWVIPGLELRRPLIGGSKMKRGANTADGKKKKKRNKEQKKLCSWVLRVNARFSGLIHFSPESLK